MFEDDAAASTEGDAAAAPAAAAAAPATPAAARTADTQRTGDSKRRTMLFEYNNVRPRLTDKQTNQVIQYWPEFPTKRIRNKIPKEWFPFITLVKFKRYGTKRRTIFCTINLDADISEDLQKEIAKAKVKDPRLYHAWTVRVKFLIGKIFRTLLKNASGQEDVLVAKNLMNYMLTQFREQRGIKNSEATGLVDDDDDNPFGSQVGEGNSEIPALNRKQSAMERDFRRWLLKYKGQVGVLDDLADLVQKMKLEQQGNEGSESEDEGSESEYEGRESEYEGSENEDEGSESEDEGSEDGSGDAAGPPDKAPDKLMLHFAKLRF